MAIDQDPRDYDCCMFIHYHIPDFYGFLFLFLFFSFIPLFFESEFFF